MEIYLNFLPLLILIVLKGSLTEKVYFGKAFELLNTLQTFEDVSFLSEVPPIE